MNPVTNRFCGMCGSEQENAIRPLITASPADRDLEPHLAEAVTRGARLEHHHHHYHHLTVRHEPYILVAATVLVIMIAWQQWQERKTISQSVPASQVLAAKEATQDTKSNQISRAVDVPPLQNDLEAPIQREAGGRRGPLRQQKVELTQGIRPVQRAALTPPALASLNLVDNSLPTLVPPPDKAPKVTESAGMPARARVVAARAPSEERLLERVMPQYPETAARAGVKGEVVVDVMIGKNGTIRELKLVHGSPVLASAAMDAIRQWKYRPYLVNSEPVEIWTRITIRFGE